MREYKSDISAIFDELLPWDSLVGRNVLVAGATGLIGGCLVDALMTMQKEGCNVYAMGRDEQRAKRRFSSYLNNRRFHFVKHDITSPLAGFEKYDYIIHAASNGSPNFFRSAPVEVGKSNVLGLINLCEYGREHGVKRLLYVSSGEVYGEGNGLPFSESDSGYIDCMNPRSCYPTSKRMAETLCASYSAEYSMDIVVARPCHVYGPFFTETDNRVYAQFIRNAINGNDIILKSSGAQIRSWCYVVDCVRALLYVLLKGQQGEAYNVADSKSVMSIRELATLVADVSGLRVTVDADNAPSYIIGKALFNTGKLERLGWNVSGSIVDKMRSTIREQREYCK